MKRVVVIADDLTGAADSGVCFRRAGLSARIVFGLETDLPADVMVFSSESRQAGEEEARLRVRRLLAGVKDAELIYKKIDSTLRGSPGAELDEILDGLGIEKALVAPAFPAQGRTTVNGMQLLHGAAIERSAPGGETAGSDLKGLFQACRRPVREIGLKALRDNPSEVREILGRPGAGLIIADAESEADLQILAKAALECGLRLCCGSAGLASALADCLVRRGPSQDEPPFHGRKGPVLAIAGSRNGVSVEQVETARKAGLRVFELDPDFGKQTGRPAQELMAASRALDQGEDAVLTTSSSRDSACGAAGVAEELGRQARYLAEQHAIGGLVLTGGDVAMAVITALKAEGISLWGELQPGIPLGNLAGGALPDLPVITKAGGFGRREALIQAIHYLRAAGSEPSAAQET